MPAARSPWVGSLTDVLLLAIDTSTTAITVGLHDGARSSRRSTTLDARGARRAPRAAASRGVLAAAGAAPADVTDVVVGIGPGPFTGLRVGIVTGRTFAFALGLPVHGLCSLDALAARGAGRRGRRGELLVATDARRKEVYWAPRTSSGRRRRRARVTEPAVDRARRAAGRAVRALPAVGRGAAALPRRSVRRRPGPLDVSAAALAAAQVAAAPSCAGEPARLDGSSRSTCAAPTPLPPARNEVDARERDATPTLRELRLDRPRRPSPPSSASCSPTTPGPRRPGGPSSPAGRAATTSCCDDADGVAGYAGLDHGGDVADVMTVAVAPRRAGPRPRAACCSTSCVAPRRRRAARGRAARGAGRQRRGAPALRARGLRGASRCAAATTSPATWTPLVMRAARCTEGDRMS